MAMASSALKIEQRDAAWPLSKVFGEQGYCNEIRLREDELSTLRRITTESWIDVIRRVAPDSVGQFEQLGIDQYHRLAHLLDHGRVWTTQVRTYSAEMVDCIRTFGIFDFFDRECPNYRICSEMPPLGDWGGPRINWRLVRPGAGVDLGPIHADYWFDALLDDWRPDPDIVRLKIWIPIYLEPGLTGFAYVPGSHRVQLPFRRKRLPDGSVKPEFDDATLPAPLQTIPTPCGTALLFNYNLVHRGANSDRATRTRVSMEFSLDLPRRPMEQRYGDLSTFI
jgi:hypothetical protein